MKLFSFKVAGRSTIGLQLHSSLVDLPTAYALFQQLKGPFEVPRLPGDMLRFVAGGKTALHLASETLAFVARRPPIPVGERIIYGMDEVEVIAPILRPGKILCVESASANPNKPAENGSEEPSLSIKLVSSIIGPGGAIVPAKRTQELSCDLRLAVVIGETMRDEPISDVMRKIAGYTLLNDISAPDGPFGLTQGFDTFCPMGPCIATPSEFNDAAHIQTRRFLNDELRNESSNTGAKMPNWTGWLAKLSHFITLEPGDIIALENLGPTKDDPNPGRLRIKHGDRVRFEADGVGTLENRVDARDR